MMNRFVDFTNSDVGVAAVDWFVLTVGTLTLGFAMFSAALADGEQISAPSNVVFVSDSVVD